MRRHHIHTISLAGAAAGSLWAIPVCAQSASPPAEPPAIFSIGQPRQTQFAASALLTVTRSAPARGHFSLAARRAILTPVTGLLGARGEAYATTGRDSYGLIAGLESRALGLFLAGDWDVGAGRLSPLVGLEMPIRRGGIIGHGSMARLDWRPGSARSLAFGLTMPIGQPLAGRTRPRRTDIDLATVAGSTDRSMSVAEDRSVPAAEATKLADVLTTLGAYSNAYSSRAAGVIARSDVGYTAAVARYDSVLRRLFAPATRTPALCDRVLRAARRVAFESLVLPIDSLFGRPKEPRGDLSALRALAGRNFAEVLRDSLGAEVDAQRAAAVMDAWMRAIGAVYRELLDDAQDSRFVWLPVELALASDQFDEQLEVDSLVARAVGHPFTDRNDLTYLRSSDLPLEIARSLYATREYHVLWTHDFTGQRESGAVDNVAFSMVADAYLPALTAAVRRYDSTGVLPVYIVLQDQFFYEPRNDRLWMTILEDPMNASMRLPGDNGQREALLLQRQRELRSAVASSVRLQRDARASGNAAQWLRARVKVHVNVVEPSDFSFRSDRIIPGIPLVPDNIMRDHRKLVFYDLNERDPYRGALLIMGVGVGEHYASATWEDRGYRVRGPATLEARRAVREALLRNGFDEAQIPPPLRPVASTQAIVDRADTRDYVGRALQVHNEPGFAKKESSVARAMLYNLAPPGSVIIVPDPMWLSNTWAGMVAAAAARGCQVYVIAPSEANAPSPQQPLMDVQYRIASRLLELRTSLDPAIRRAHGDLRVGIFAGTAPINDPAARAAEIRNGLGRAPWIRRAIPFDDKTLKTLEQPAVIASSGDDATALARDEQPRAQQLHQKSQLVARPGAIAALLRQPGWDVALAQSLRMQARETARFADQLGYTTPQVDTLATRRNDALLRGYEQGIPESERKRVSFYFSLGTQNEDDRGIVSDAEATLIVSGVQASAGLVDLFTLMARSTWITTDRELATFIPAPKGFLARLAWRVRATF